ncbi:two-component sensor histidine kinase [Propioniciclava coleopterorum]|uniref:Sensor-like histidine kinase SenX3 n=1 Tax=Propioniciclava coleopterorum TaxID=2714937 RepID=A0A6G7Y4J9_9ACTN|nr:ATP-binding protein [Propioniciclava coleopterorum]QIK71713.1 two-component sensor histidine kinase [Propioniciclava coleopterorum]
MTPALAALLGVVVGALFAVVATYVLMRVRLAAPPPDPTPERQRVMDALRAGAVLVGDQDEILACNSFATDVGLVRADRVAIPALLDLVREVRRTGETATVNLDQTRSGRAGQRLAVRVVKLDDGVVLVIADDRAAALRVEASARDFMANATHELKTPVGAITLLAEATEQAADDPDAVERFAGKIQREAARLTQLVTQIVQLSRVQGTQLATVGVVDVDDVVTTAIERSGHLAEQRHVSLTVSGAKGLLIRGSRDQLVTALLNLLHNAIHYSDDRARVVVTTRLVPGPDGDRVTIAVSDNGIGISEEDQLRIFERFYRVDFARSRQTGGTGLGLSIVSEIVEAHGGTISLWSRVGSGSTFTMELPAAPDLEEDEDA